MMNTPARKVCHARPWHVAVLSSVETLEHVVSAQLSAAPTVILSVMQSQSVDSMLTLPVSITIEEWPDMLF